MPVARGAWSGWCAAFALVGAGSLSANRPSTINVVVAGDTQGYLAPCGCTSPMTGGIRRLATAVAQYRGTGGLFLENGGLLEENPRGLVALRQGVLKALALADAFRAMRVDAVNIGQEELTAGPGTLTQIEELTDRATLSTSLEPSATNNLPQWLAHGPFLIGGVTPAAVNLAAITGETAVPVKAAVHRLAEEALKRGLTPILMFRGTEPQAEAFARDEPGLALIVYQSAGTAPLAPIVIGHTMLVTPGDQTKNLVRLEFDGTAFSNYRAVTLTPNYADEPKVSKIYRSYQAQVGHAHLIELLPRTKTAAFAGSAACASCHGAAFKIWHASAHSHALADLERQGSERDPECVGCHVTGLASTVGFRSRLQTRKLADVSCEACHGPAQAHAHAPRTYRLPKLTEKSCLGCHTPNNSPNFAFSTFWPKVSHRLTPLHGDNLGKP